VKWLVAVLAVLAAAPASAQSKRYPPEIPDKDREREQHSTFWEQALAPGTVEYGKMIDDARALRSTSSNDDTRAAIDKLDAAVKLAPTRPEAYLERGRAQLALRNWARCADDLGTAEERKVVLDAGERTQLLRDRGVCLARAGRLGEAERTLARATATGPAGGELWLRLGEVRIAMGKLDEAAAALDAAIDAGGIQEVFARWLLAGAYDRARQPSEARDAINVVIAKDRVLTTLLNQVLPLVGAGEVEYLTGLAWLADAPAGRDDIFPRPEYAQSYFRRFLQLAPDSPWRRRAEEHLREAQAMDFSLWKDRGSALFDLDAARVTVGKGMRALHACVAKLPFTTFQVSVIRKGPASDRPMFRAPAAGPSVDTVLDVGSGDNRDEIDLAKRCLMTVADKLPLPAPKDHDVYTKVSFYVTAP
jgi:tetratricopeptide (TPR) repeat protein